VATLPGLMEKICVARDELAGGWDSSPVLSPSDAFHSLWVHFLQGWLLGGRNRRRVGTTKELLKYSNMFAVNCLSTPALTIGFPPRHKQFISITQTSMTLSDAEGATFFITPNLPRRTRLGYH
jgi:hypothetical protein